MSNIQVIHSTSIKNADELIADIYLKQTHNIQHQQMTTSLPVYAPVSNKEADMTYIYYDSMTSIILTFDAMLSGQWPIKPTSNYSIFSPPH